MTALENQLTFNNFIDRFDELINPSHPKLLYLSSLYININGSISFSFKRNYYSAVGLPRKYALSSMIKFLIKKDILAIPESNKRLQKLHLSRDI